MEIWKCVVTIIHTKFWKHLLHVQPKHRSCNCNQQWYRCKGIMIKDAFRLVVWKCFIYFYESENNVGKTIINHPFGNEFLPPIYRDLGDDAPHVIKTLGPHAEDHLGSGGFGFGDWWDHTCAHDTQIKARNMGSCFSVVRFMTRRAI